MENLCFQTVMAARGCAVNFVATDVAKHAMNPLHKDDIRKKLWPTNLPSLKVTKICVAFARGQTLLASELAHPSQCEARTL